MRYGRHVLFCVPPVFPSVRAHEVHGWSLNKERGIGANSSLSRGTKGLLRLPTALRASSTFVLLATRPSERVRRVRGT